MAEQTYPGLVLAAPKSGTGKTILTLGLLKAFQDRGLHLAAFKCGPDYIDPMYHEYVLGRPSYHLDPFLSGQSAMRTLFCRQAKQADFSVVEGVMGYYDGVGGTTEASTYEVATLTKLPVVMILDGRLDVTTLCDTLENLLRQKADSRIRGVILNRMAPGRYESVKARMESAFPLTVYGYMPEIASPLPGSRYLGLTLPQEMPGEDWITPVSEQMAATLDLPGLIQLGYRQAGTWWDEETFVPAPEPALPVRIGLARDAAFCFTYAENLDILRDRGAQLVPFSPLADAALPEDLNGLLLPGGYPELYGQALSENGSMRASIRDALRDGLPCMAECGGFLYLTRQLTCQDGATYEMVGALPGGSTLTDHLHRFGYVTLTGGTVFGTRIGPIRAHEYHYADSQENGDAFLAVKPVSKKTWRCIISTPTLLAGYPHLYYWGNESVPAAFLSACRAYHNA